MDRDRPLQRVQPQAALRRVAGVDARIGEGGKKT